MCNFGVGEVSECSDGGMKFFLNHYSALGCKFVGISTGHTGIIGTVVQYTVGWFAREGAFVVSNCYRVRLSAFLFENPAVTAV